MTLTAILYDVHGNLAALEAVREDAVVAGARSFILGGDYALFGPYPLETVTALRELPGATAWIRGNGERWSAEPEQAPDNEVVPGAIGACREALGARTVAELVGLPEALVRDGTRFCHASPISDVRSFLPQPDPDDDQLIGQASEARIVFGHTHLQFQRRGPSHSELVNPGSVGMPFDGDPRAAYALLAPDGEIELRRVAYDHHSAADALLERFAEQGWARTVARRLLAARPVDPG
ncbi:MAG: metallophosphoesterase family protein [Solirubrobacteraceae bacterium]